MASIDFKQILFVLLVSFGLLFALDAVGILDGVVSAIGAKIPINIAIPTIEGIVFPAVNGLIAIIAVSFISTLIAFAMTEGFEHKKMIGMFVILACVSSIIWIAAPQILPKILQPAAAVAQSLVTGQVPQAIFLP